MKLEVKTIFPATELSKTSQDMIRAYQEKSDLEGIQAFEAEEDDIRYEITEKGREAIQ